MVIWDAPWPLSSVSRALKGFDSASFPAKKAIDTAKKAVDIKALGTPPVDCRVVRKNHRGVIEAPPQPKRRGLYRSVLADGGKRRVSSDLFAVDWRRGEEREQ
jgi:hypothetical protein